MRLNGETIPLDGNDVNRVTPDAFEDFLQTQKGKVENGDLDGEIESALQQDGPGKALIRVRAIEN